MVTRVAYTLLLAMSALFAFGTRFAPQLVARLAFVPVRRAVAIPLPPRAALALTPPVDGGGQYRALPTRALVLDALPGESRVERDDQIVQFEPASGCVLAHRKRSPAQLLCVDISVGIDELVLRARRFPSTELSYIAVLVVGVARTHALRLWPFWLAVTLGIATYVLTGLRRANARSMDAVVAEIEARVALANGDPLPLQPAPPAVSAGSRFTAPDEWTCACDHVNPRKRSLCGRCWSQRPKG